MDDGFSKSTTDLAVADGNCIELWAHGPKTEESSGDVMASIEQLSLECLDGIDLLPLAVLRHPVSYFEGTRRLRFTREHDDLDEYAMAALMLREDNDRAPTLFALRSYRGGPTGSVDVLLPAVLLDAAIERESIVRKLAAQLHVDENPVGWADQPRSKTQRLVANERHP